MPTVQQLEALLEADPNDVFLNFGLAMAFASDGKPAQAVKRFERTLALDPHYVSAYFQKARVLADMGEVDDAIETLKGGIETAGAVGDQHAQGEMSEFLATLR